MSFHDHFDEYATALLALRSEVPETPGGTRATKDKAAKPDKNAPVTPVDPESTLPVRGSRAAANAHLLARRVTRSGWSGAPVIPRTTGRLPGRLLPRVSTCTACLALGALPLSSRSRSSRVIARCGVGRTAPVLPCPVHTTLCPIVGRGRGGLGCRGGGTAGSRSSGGAGLAYPAAKPASPTGRGGPPALLSTLSSAFPCPYCNSAPAAPQGPSKYALDCALTGLTLVLAAGGSHVLEATAEACSVQPLLTLLQHHSCRIQVRGMGAERELQGIRRF